MTVLLEIECTKAYSLKEGDPLLGAKNMCRGNWKVMR